MECAGCRDALDVDLSCHDVQDAPTESDDTLTAASTNDTEEEEQSAEEAPREPSSTRGWRPKGPGPPPIKRPALKGSALRRKPQLDRIAESSGSQPTVQEEDLLQVGIMTHSGCIVGSPSRTQVGRDPCAA